MLTRFDKNPFRQAHHKIIDTLMSCDNETQFVTATHMVNNFINWVNFYVDVWGRWSWLHHRQWKSWYNEVDNLINDLNWRVEQMCKFIQTKHQESKEQSEPPKKFVVLGFHELAEKNTNNG